MKTQPISLAIDGNEANILNRVGSNVYAYEIIKAIYKLVNQDQRFLVTVLLRQPPLAHLPAENERWHYQVIGPRRLWVYWSLSKHLDANPNHYQVFYTPGHYVPLTAPMPVISSIMDLGFLSYPRSFKFKDWLQLSLGTKWAVKKAARLVAISQFTQQEIKRYYKIPLAKIVVAPAAPPARIKLSPAKQNQICFHLGIDQPFFLYLGTLQPRKNLVNLIKAYEVFATNFVNAHHNSLVQLPQLVLAGKVGWLAEEILATIKHSKFAQKIIQPGFITDQQKAALYSKALANILVSPYEGFGIPPLEGMQYGCLPIVANSSSLPEVIGLAGLKVDADSILELAEALNRIYKMEQPERYRYQALGRKQLKKFTWKQSAQTVLTTIQNLV